MWYKRLCGLVLICLLSSSAVAQEPLVEQRLNTLSLSVYGLAPVLVYERTIPFNQKVGMIGSVGGFYYGEDYLGFTLGATVYSGSPRHKVELGAVYLNNALTIGYSAYRFTGNSGFFARGGLGYAFMPEGDREGGIVPIAAVGYAF